MSGSIAGTWPFEASGRDRTTTTRQLRRPVQEHRIQLVSSDLWEVGWGSSGPTWELIEQRLREMLQIQPNWDSYGGQAPSRETLAYAVAELSSLKAMRVPPPNVSPSGDGQVLASWSGGGIDVELWFEGPYQETLLVDDERGERGYAGPDPLLIYVTQALRTIQSRT
jgi:hypothetical protein